jgi:tetratricopeptide (TPR) repeat protein
LAAFDHQETDLGLRLLGELEAEPPQDEAGTIALAAVHAAAFPLPDEIRRSKVRALLQPLAARAADHHFLAMQRVEQLVGEDMAEDAIRLLQKRSATGGGPATWSKLHELCNRLGFRAEADHARRRWLEERPRHAAAALVQADALGEVGDLPQACDVLQRAAASVPGDSLLNDRLFDVAVRLGRVEVARGAHARLYRQRSESVAAIKAASDLARSAGASAEAAAGYERIAAHQDAHASDLEAAGRSLLQLGRDAAGVSALSKALDKEPARHGVRHLLTKLAGGTERHPAFVEFRRDARPLVEALTPGERETTAPSSLVLDQMLIEVYSDGSYAQETHVLRRINDTRGVENHQTADDAANAEDLVAVRTIGADGKVYVPNRVDGAFSMPRLEPGAFVDMVYRDYRPAPGAAPWRLTTFLFQSADEPFVLSELVVILPSHHPGRFRTRNFPAAPETKDLADGRTAYVFRRRDVPRLPVERLAPPVADVAPVVTYGTDRAGVAGGRRALDYHLFRTRSSPIVAAKAAELTRGLTTGRERVEAIHRFVQETIPTSRGSFDPTAVLLRKQGSRFYLQVALLREAGVPMTPAVAMQDAEALHREPQPLFTGDEHYPVDAVRIEPEGEEPMWLFADHPRWAPLGSIPADRMGAPALLLASGGPSAARVPGGDLARAMGMDVRSTMTISESGRARLSTELTVLGTPGYDAADQISNLEDNVRQLYARQFASQVFKGWAIDKIAIKLARGQPLSAEATLSKRRVLDEAGDVRLLPLPMAKTELVSQLGDRGDRSLPLKLTSQDATRWHVLIDPGTAHRFTELPPSIHVRHPLFDYSLVFQREGNAVAVRREMVQRGGSIPPSQFGEWLSTLRRLDLAEEAVLKLVRV